jgi:hypothetical protein
MLWAGEPDIGAGKVVELTHGASGWTSATPLVFSSDLGADRIGAAFAQGNFIPNVVGAPGRQELVVGAPGYASSAGAFFLVDFDLPVGSSYVMQRFQQTSASPE